MNTTRIFSLWLALFYLVACAPSPATPEAYVLDPDEIATSVAATLDALLADISESTAEATEPPDRLPHSLYFLSDRSGIEQVWRVEKDGESISQVTFSELAVIDYDVFPSNGRIVYVTENQLMLESLSGLDDRLTLQIDNADQASLPGSAFGSPRFSPDGQQIAYAQAGLNLLNVSSGESRLLVENRYDELEAGSLSPRELFFPLSFSPDGKNLLISIAYLEGGTLAFLDLESLQMTEFQSTGIVCCQSAWAQQSDAIFVASPYLGLVDSGLWQYALEDGKESALINSSGNDAVLNFVGWPFQHKSGTLHFFYSRTTGLPDGDVPLFMVRAALNALNEPETLREDSFLIQEALWAPDASLAVILPTLQGKAGPLVIAHVDGRPLEILLEGARMLRWGP